MDPVKDANKIVSDFNKLEVLKRFYELASKNYGYISFHNSGGVQNQTWYTVRIGNDWNHVQRVQLDPNNFDKFVQDLSFILNWMGKVGDSCKNLETNI